MGGQGVISSGYILGQAAELYDEKFSVMAPSYGPEARGGTCKSDLIISDEPISYPKIMNPDCLIAMSEEAHNEYNYNVKKNGLIIFDEDMVSISPSLNRKDLSYNGVPALKIASELGNALVSNIVIIGFFTKITKILSVNSVRKSIKKRFPRYVEINLNAFERGLNFNT